MTMCHPDSGKVSCGSCCGLFNLDLNRDGFRQILLERTEEFHSTVDFSISHTIPAYRQSREKKENQFPKKDPTTYNCPYLGYLEGLSGKIGCMIHPSRTGNPKSQNYSFYGASICLGYECKNRERHTESFWIQFFRNISADSVEYSHHSANHPWVRRIENSLRIPSQPPEGISREDWIQDSIATLEENEETIRYLWKKILESNSDTIHHLTSFEIDYETSESPEESESILKSITGI